MKLEVEKLLLRSGKTIEAAQDLLRTNHIPDAASRAYYAMFYAAQDLLKFHGFETRKHSGVESILGSEFVNKGLIEVEYHRKFTNGRGLRDLADYGIEDEILEPVVIESIENAKQFLKRVLVLVQ